MEIPQNKNKSIIEIIQKMVRENEPEEKVIDTLSALGVSKEQAKRLLLIAQADTFTLLSSEINKIVEESITKQQKRIEESSQKFVDKLLTEQGKTVTENIQKEFLKQKVILSETQQEFQKSVNDSISKIAKLNEEVYTSSKANEKMIDAIKKDLTETKLKGIRVRRSIARNALMLFGIISFILAFVLMIASIAWQFNLDSVTGAVVFALIGSVIIYLSVNI